MLVASDLAKELMSNNIGDKVRMQKAMNALIIQCDQKQTLIQHTANDKVLAWKMASRSHECMIIEAPGRAMHKRPPWSQESFPWQPAKSFKHEMRVH